MLTIFQLAWIQSILKLCSKGYLYSKKYFFNAFSISNGYIFLYFNQTAVNNGSLYDKLPLKIKKNRVFITFSAHFFCKMHEDYITLKWKKSFI